MFRVIAIPSPIYHTSLYLLGPEENTLVNMQATHASFLKIATNRGRLVTDDWLRVLGAPSVFGLGDCAIVDDKPLPQTAQVMSDGMC